MAITVKISDSTDTKTFKLIEAPLISSPVIAETDVTTIDNNISTYYTGTKRRFQVSFGYMTDTEYSLLLGFRDRQYTNMKYPTITFTGATNLPSTAITAKMVLSDQRIINNCGLVEGVSAEFRESKQMV